MRESELSLERVIGLNGCVRSSVHVRPGADEWISTAGCVVVITPFGGGPGSASSAQKFLRGHDDEVSACQPSPSGKYLATGQTGTNADVVVWKLNSQTIRYRFSEHVHGISAVAFSPDERFLATLGDKIDSMLIIWDLQTGMIVGKAKVDDATLVSWGPEWDNDEGTRVIRLATAGKNVTLFDLEPSRGSLVGVLARMGTQKREFTCLAWSPDQEFLFAGSRSGDIVRFMTKNGILKSTHEGSQGGVVSLDISPDGVMFVGGGDGSITIYDPDGPTEYLESLQTKLAEDASPRLRDVTSMSFFGDRNSFLATTLQGCVFLVQALDLSFEQIVATHGSGLSDLTLPLQTSGVCVGTDEGRGLTAWGLDDFAPLFRTTLLRPALCVAGTPDTIIVGCEDGNVYGHDLISGDPLWQVTDAHHGGVKCLTVADNKRFFVTGGTTGEVRIWDMGTRALIAQLEGHTQPVRCLRLFEDNAHLVSCGSDRSFITWDLKENVKVSQHAQRMGGMHSVGITPNKSIVSVGQEKRISFWDLRESKAQHVISPVKGGEQLCIVVSPCGRYLGCGGTDRDVTVWDIESKECIRRGSAHAGDIVSLCFEEGSNRIITAGRDGNILIWRM